MFRSKVISVVCSCVDRRKKRHMPASTSLRIWFNDYIVLSSAANTNLTKIKTSAIDRTKNHVHQHHQDISDDDQCDNNCNKNKIISTLQTPKTTAYLALAKAKLSALVVTTTVAGFVAAGGPLYDQLPLAGYCLAGTALCSSSAAALNQIYELDRDSLMKRTQNRPLVTGILTVEEATLAAVAWGASGTAILMYGTDVVTAALGLGNLVLYAGLYTSMKPRSCYNTYVGAIVGSIPPVMGWSAATGGLLFDIDAIILGSTLYFWQLPHFFSLSYMYRQDYERGGFSMLSGHEVNGERTSSAILNNSVYLSAIPFVSTYAGVTSSMFSLGGIVLNLYALRIANHFRQDRTNANARKVFLTSLWYLPCWLMLFLLHNTIWDEDRDRDTLRGSISNLIYSVRSKGWSMCLQVVVKSMASDTYGAVDTDQFPPCPVAMTKKSSQVIEDTASVLIIEGERRKDEEI